MSDIIRENLTAWALGLITVTLAGSVGWVFKISSAMVELRVEMSGIAREADRNRSVVEGVISHLSDADNSLSKLVQQHNTLSVFLSRIEARQNLHTDRISAHEALGLHHEASLQINGIKINLDNLGNKLAAVEGEINKGERYTLDMWQQDKDMIYKEIASTENNLHNSINELIDLQRRILKQGNAKKEKGSSF